MIRVPHRNDLLMFIPFGAVCAEVGVFTGLFSEKILEIVRPSMLYLIDSWSTEYKLKWYVDTPEGWQQQEMTGAEAYGVACDRFASHFTTKMLRGKSVDMLLTLPDCSLDMVYVDADHSRQAVMFDLEASLTKMRAGGWIMGHDYCSVFPGVVSAVDQFCSDYGLSIDVLTDESPPDVPGGAGVAFNSYGIRVT